MYLKLKAVGGCSIGISLILAVVTIIVAWYLSTFLIPAEFGNLKNVEHWIVLAVSTLLFIVSIALHEMAHFIVADMVGFRPPRMIFSVTEGVLLSDLCRTNEKQNIGSRNKLKIAIAGPLMSLIMALLFATAWWLESQDTSAILFAQKKSIQTMFYYAAIGNAIFGLVNLIPAFPLDGSVIWAALLERRSENKHKRCSNSLNIMRINGIGIIFCCLGAASYLLLIGDFLDGIWLILAVWTLESDIRTYAGQNSRFFGRQEI